MAIIVSLEDEVKQLLKAVQAFSKAADQARGSGNKDLEELMRQKAEAARKILSDLANGGRGEGP